VLRRIQFGPKRDEVTGEWRNLHNEELHNLYSSPSIVALIKLRRIRWAVYVAGMGEKVSLCKILLGKVERKRPIRYLRCCRLDLSGSGYRTVAGSCEHGNEPSGSVKLRTLLEWLINCWVLRKGSAPLSYLFKNISDDISIIAMSRAQVGLPKN
jgi:hypothetical protein